MSATPKFKSCYGFSFPEKEETQVSYLKDTKKNFYNLEQSLLSGFKVDYFFPWILFLQIFHNFRNLNSDLITTAFIVNF